MKVIIYNKKHKRRYICYALLLCIAIVACIKIFTSNPKQVDLYPESVLGVPMYTQLVAEGDSARPGIERHIKYVVIHETGNFAHGADAKRHSLYITENNKTDTSWHYTVDDHSIYHHIPDTEVAWHAGDSLKKNGGNLCGIGVEICVNRDGDFEKAFDNAARLTAYLVENYDLSVDDVKQHGDFINKNCPQSIRDEGRTEEFKERVKKYLQEIKTQEKKEGEKYESNDYRCELGNRKGYGACALGDGI